MARKKNEITQVFIIIEGENKFYIRKYLTKTAKIVGVQPNTISKWFMETDEPYKRGDFKVIKCKNVDLKGEYRNNFH